MLEIWFIRGLCSKFQVVLLANEGGTLDEAIQVANRMEILGLTMKKEKKRKKSRRTDSSQGSSERRLTI